MRALAEVDSEGVESLLVRGLAVPDSVRDASAVAAPDAPPLEDANGLSEAVAQLEAEALANGVSDMVAQPVWDSLGDMDIDAAADLDADTLPDADAGALGVPVSLSLGELDALGHSLLDMDEISLGAASLDGVGAPLPLNGGAPDADTLGLGVDSSLALGVSLAQDDGDGDAGALMVSSRNVAPALPLGDALLRAEAERESDVVAGPLCERTPLAERDGTSVAEPLAVTGGDNVSLGDADEVERLDGDAVPHAELERESDDDAEPLFERVLQAVADRVGETEPHEDAERDCMTEDDRELVTVVVWVAAGEHPAAGRARP